MPVNPRRSVRVPGQLSAVFVLILALILAGCSGAKKEQDDVRDVARAFAAAMTDGDYQKAASYTSDPSKALADLTFVAQQLEEPSFGYEMSSAKASTAEASVQYDVHLTVRGHELSYPIDAQLVTGDGGTWQLSWTPALVHPKLTGDTHLQLVDRPGNKPIVLDRQGQPLMSEQLVTVIRVDPAAATDVAGTAQTLAAVLTPVVPSLTADSIAQQISGATEPFSLVALRQEDAAAVALPELAGVSSNKQTRLLSSVKGLHSPVLTDLGKVWKQAAAESTGWTLQLKDAANEKVADLLDVPAAPIDTLATTFDSGTQTAAQAAVDQVAGQAVIVAIQPSTGGVLAVAQNAAADAEGPIALTGQYPPGSTFKIVSTAAVLTAGTATADTELPCPGKASVKGRTIPNDEGFDLGTVPLHTAFAHSCNTTIATLAAELPSSALHDQAMQLGLGVDYVAPGLTTITGSVPSASGDAEMVEDSIGQGKVVASPFGMALVAASIAHGSTPLPLILPGRQTTADQQPGAPSGPVLDDLRAMMTETVQSGTATAVADLDGIAGKTGTAQYGDGTTSHGWFVGYYEDIAFAVLLVGGGSSKPAVAVAGSFLRALPG